MQLNNIFFITHFLFHYDNVNNSLWGSASWSISFRVWETQILDLTTQKMFHIFKVHFECMAD